MAKNEEKCYPELPRIIQFNQPDRKKEKHMSLSHNTLTALNNTYLIWKEQLINQ